MIMFIDRDREIEKLLEIAKSGKSELVLVYGRRRVGKSRLLTEFSKKVNSLYLISDLSENILDIFAKQIGEEFVRFNDWDDFFEYISKCKYDVIIIDEFQYLYDINKAWPSILQRWWEKLKHANKKIILSGSLIATIYKIAMGQGSALYGRKTYEMNVKPLKFRDIHGFFPGYNAEEIVEAYSILGGVPRYLEEFDSEKKIKENIEERILDKNSFLYNEPFNLLFEEFRDPAPYITILSEIAAGYTRFADISSKSLIAGTKLPKYLLVLERAGLIRKSIPVTEKRQKSKTTRYKVADMFYNFWFNFVFTNKSSLEQGKVSWISSLISRDLNSYVGRCFEEICIQFVADSGIKYTRIGSWWHKDKEINIVAIDDNSKSILFGECKWKNNVDAGSVLKDLKEKATHVEWNAGMRKENYIIFAKSFSNLVNEGNVMCIELKDIIKSFAKPDN